MSLTLKISAFIFGVLISYIINDAHSCMTKTDWISVLAYHYSHPEKSSVLEVTNLYNGKDRNGIDQDYSEDLDTDELGPREKRNAEARDEAVINLDDEEDELALERFGRRIFNSSDVESINKTVKELNSGYFALKKAYESRKANKANGTTAGNSTDTAAGPAGGPAAPPAAGPAAPPAAPAEEPEDTGTEPPKDD